MDILQQYKEEPLFDIPEHYFDQLQQNVMQRVNEVQKHQNRVKNWISAVSVAASMALIVVLSVYLFVNRNVNEPFYVHDETILIEDTNSLNLANVIDISIEEPLEIIQNSEPLSPNLSATPETIAYVAVDYYLDDNTIENFYEIMYDLECYYDY
jgi:hypothetical protein